MDMNRDVDTQVQKYASKSFVLENKLKNVVIRMLEGIREQKNKKSIKEGVEMIMQKNASLERKNRAVIQQTYLDQYEDLAALTCDSGGLVDKAYNRILVTQDRLLKVLTGHSHAIDSLENKLEKIWTSRRKE